MSLKIVYFHGYGSSVKSDKVRQLSNLLDCTVHAFPVDVDPQVAWDELTHYIDMLLLEDMHVDDQLVFVGTSLGGWVASELGLLYDIPAVVINPSCNPAYSLLKYGVDSKVRRKYSPIKFSHKNVYFFAEQDEVIVNSETVHFLQQHDYEVYVVPGASHRFDGEPIRKVAEVIRKKFVD